MKTAHKLALIAPLLFASSLGASISITLNTVGLADETGTPTNGMSYAILVDTEGDGFENGSYYPFNINANEQFLPVSEGDSDDYYLFGSSGISQTTYAPPLGGDGAIGSVTDIPYNPSIVSSGDDFGVIWFPQNGASAGNSYGFVSGSDWVFGSNGDALSELAEVSPGEAEYTVVPEPATYAGLFGLSVLSWVAIRWRQRSRSS